MMNKARIHWLFKIYNGSTIIKQKKLLYGVRYLKKYKSSLNYGILHGFHTHQKENCYHFSQDYKIQLQEIRADFNKISM